MMLQSVLTDVKFQIVQSAKRVILSRQRMTVTSKAQPNIGVPDFKVQEEVHIIMS